MVNVSSKRVHFAMRMQDKGRKSQAENIPLSRFREIRKEERSSNSIDHFLIHCCIGQIRWSSKWSYGFLRSLYIACDVGEFTLMGVTSEIVLWYKALTWWTLNLCLMTLSLVRTVDKSSEVNSNDFASSDSSVKTSEPKSNDSTSCASTSSISTSESEAKLTQFTGRPKPVLTDKPKVPEPVPTGRKRSPFPVPSGRRYSPSVTSGWENLIQMQKMKGSFDCVVSRNMTGWITGKGTNQTPTLDFEMSYYVKELATFQLVRNLSDLWTRRIEFYSQHLDCSLLSKDFMLPDEFDGKADEGYIVGYSPLRKLSLKILLLMTGVDSPHDSAEEIFQQELARLKVPPGSIPVPTDSIQNPSGGTTISPGNVSVPTGGVPAALHTGRDAKFKFNNVMGFVDLPEDKYAIRLSGYSKIRKCQGIMDVKSVFLYGRIDEEVYVTQPKGFVDPQSKRVTRKHKEIASWYTSLCGLLVIPTSVGDLQRRPGCDSAICGLMKENLNECYGRTYFLPRITSSAKSDGFLSVKTIKCLFKNQGHSYYFQLEAVKKIFRSILKSQPKLGVYGNPRESPFVIDRLIVTVILLGAKQG
ncbi:hypothetical protein Tco_0802808 [Tanacetum coccineum]|uniref:Reverse transcriptase Ty1/copia-type domain-containing protein n=1 Tax=Tanacetum coccineum TaxID=301880 RepID=A0ABQ5A0P5_9ASTR